MSSWCLHLNGEGTTDAPTLLEAMGQDLGAVAEGFQKNFLVYELRIDGTNFVQIVDLSDNSEGVTNEAVYVDRLMVAADATLDLNGLNLYVVRTRLHTVCTVGKQLLFVGGIADGCGRHNQSHPPRHRCGRGDHDEGCGVQRQLYGRTACTRWKDFHAG